MDEIRRLQEELQKAQQSGSINRLSERNCIELIMKLKEMNLVEVWRRAPRTRALILSFFIPPMGNSTSRDNSLNKKSKMKLQFAEVCFFIRDSLQGRMSLNELQQVSLKHVIDSLSWLI
jgi:hypothetical protein